MSLRSVSAAVALAALVIGPMPGFAMITDPGKPGAALVAPIAHDGGKGSLPAEPEIRVAPDCRSCVLGSEFDFG